MTTLPGIRPGVLLPDDAGPINRATHTASRRLDLLRDGAELPGVLWVLRVCSTTPRASFTPASGSRTNHRRTNDVGSIGSSRRPDRKATK